MNTDNIETRLLKYYEWHEIDGRDWVNKIREDVKKAADELTTLRSTVERLEKNLTSLDLVIDGHVRSAFVWTEKIAKADALAEMLQTARVAIEQAPDDAFGWGQEDNEVWPLKVELITSIDHVLTAYQGEGK